MPRPKKVDRPIDKHLRLPQSVVAPTETLLYSEVEGRVPHGAWQELVERLLRDWLSKQGVKV